MATFNFSELQQKADRNIHNWDEAIRKWVDFLTAPAGDTTIEYYDPNGNLIQTSVPNRNKLVQDFIADTSKVLRKIYFVDKNGSGNNDGSSTFPFATIATAINSAPNGATVDIYVKEGQTHIIDSTIYITNKKVRILSWAANTVQDPNGSPTAPVATSPIIQFTDDGNNLVGNIKLDNSALFIGGWDRSVIVEVGSSNVDITGVAVGGEVPYGGFASNSIFGIAHSAVSKAYAILSDVRFKHLRSTTFTVNRADKILFGVGYGTTIINDSANTYSDSAGNILTLAQIIAGIIRDANGTPRNVLCNTVL